MLDTDPVTRRKRDALGGTFGVTVSVLRMGFAHHFVREFGSIGIGQRSLTISTVGLPGKIRQLAKSRLQITLAVSLHAPNQQLRQKLIPSAKSYPLHALLDECQEYVRITRRRVHGFQSHINLIPYNPISDADYQRPSQQRIQAFSESLQSLEKAVSVRYSRGLGADAACGQLRASRT